MYLAAPSLSRVTWNLSLQCMDSLVLERPEHVGFSSCGLQAPEHMGSEVLGSWRRFPSMGDLISLDCGLKLYDLEITTSNTAIVIKQGRLTF